MNLEEKIEMLLKEGGFAENWLKIEDEDLVNYIVGRIVKSSSLSIVEIETRFIDYAHLYTASKIEYEKGTLQKVDVAQKIQKLIAKEKAIALTSASLFVRKLASAW